MEERSLGGKLCVEMNESVGKVSVELNKLELWYSDDVYIPFTP